MSPHAREPHKIRPFVRYAPVLCDVASNGAQGRNRTTDTAIFNRMLYQLSYLGARRTGRNRTGSGDRGL